MNLSGLYAALATPVGARGDVDFTTLDRLTEFVLERGVGGLCIGGATSEYPRFEQAERRAIVDRVARRMPKEAALVVAVGASSVPRTIELGQAAFAAGARGVLIPMPFFFRYEQIDLAAHVSHVAATLGGPCLLYDLPEFTTPLEVDTAIGLLEQDALVVGIKDSSGRPDNLMRFVEARGGQEWTLLVGDDRNLLAGLEAGWDGGVSGIACCCPELLVGLHRSMRRGELDEARRCQGLVDELITHMSVLPIPWGVRVVLRARGIDTGDFPLPLAGARAYQIARFEAWLSTWLASAGIPNLQPVAR